jgi:hypothetical protein
VPPRDVEGPPTLAWDVDDVLNDLMREWFEKAFRRDHPGSPVTYAELVDNPPHEVLGLSLEDFLASLDAFRLASIPNLVPNPVVVDWFEAHGDPFRHLAVTATPLHTAPLSVEWVLRHFGRWIRTVTVVPSPRPFDRSHRWENTKLDHLRWLTRVSVLIDDTPKNLEGAHDYGVTPILFPRPWNSESRTVTEVLLGLAS